MQLIFDTIEEMLAFAKRIKVPRGAGKSDDDDAPNLTPSQPGTGQAPPPAMPPQGGAMQFAQPGAAPSFPVMQPLAAAGMPGVDPAIATRVAGIGHAIDTAIQKGQPADGMLNWFRQMCGPDATNATLEQIKTHFLFRLPMDQLDKIAKPMGV